VNDRAICPNAAFADKEIQERVPETETIRTFRLSLSVLGDGFVEASPIKRSSIFPSSSANPHTERSAVKSSMSPSWKLPDKWA